jgi:hypothetical protein
MSLTSTFIELKRMIRIVIFFTGVYEFVSIFKKLSHANDLSSLSEDFLIYNPSNIINHKPAFYLLLIFYFFLGINRVTWAVTTQFFPKQNHFYLWVMVVLTHLAEMVFFYCLAFQPHFSQNETIPSLVMKVARLELGNEKSRLPLLLVPAIVVALAFHGPTVEFAAPTKRMPIKPTKSATPAATKKSE